MARSTSRVGRIRKGKSIALAGALSLGMLPLLAPLASATISSDSGFEIDGNLLRTTTQDWYKANDNTGVQGVLKQDGSSVVGAVLIRDDVKSDATTFPGGAKESDPSGWTPIAGSQVTPKTDITNVYAFGKSVNGKPYILNAMERLPKAGDVHLDFEYNAVVAGGIPVRQAGDVLVAYDLGGSRNSNTGAISVRVYLAGEGGVYDYTDPVAEASGSDAVSGAGVQAVLNTSPVAAGPWGTYDASGAITDADIPAFSFGEAGIDLIVATGNSAPCFNWITVKSRSSESVTSQLKDTTGPRSFPFCGGLDVKKFIDYDADGSRDDGSSANATLDPDVYGATTEPFVAGWNMLVEDASGADKCGTPANTATPAAGDPRLSCTQLPAGNYTVTETQKTGYVKTSPTGDSLSQSVAVGLTTTATATFGNACIVATTFKVTNVPSGQTPFAYYYLNGSTTRTDVTLTQGADDPETAPDESETWSGLASTAFLDNSVITWGYGVGTSTVEAEDDFDFEGSGVPNATTGLCALEKSVEFAPSTVSGLKFKDIDMDGVQDPADGIPATPDEVGLAGFTFHLVDPADETDILYTAVSCGNTGNACGTGVATGTYTFAEVEAGSYTLVEDLAATGAPAGWSKVGIYVADTDTTTEALTPAVLEEYPVAVTLGADTDLPEYGNTPLSKIRVTLEPQTNPAVTKIDTEVVCTTGEGEDLQELDMTESSASVDLDFLSEDVRLGTYTCTLTIIDP